jgi:hypothetical protein
LAIDRDSLGIGKMTPAERQKLQEYLKGIAEIAGNPSSDGIAHNISTQDICLEIISPPQKDARWYQGLSLQIDQEILKGKIVAYQIRWFNWSYFSDHEHKYIICKTSVVASDSFG